jgi:hypothetical protein
VALSGTSGLGHYRKVGDGAVQLSGAEREKRLSRGGRCPADPCTAGREAGAAAGTALIGADARIPIDDRNTVGRNGEFFSRHLRHRDAEAGPDIDLAGVDGDGPVCVNGKEAVNVVRIERFPVISRPGISLRRVRA